MKRATRRERSESEMTGVPVRFCDPTDHNFAAETVPTHNWEGKVSQTHLYLFCQKCGQTRRVAP